MPSLVWKSYLPFPVGKYLTLQQAENSVKTMQDLPARPDSEAPYGNPVRVVPKFQRPECRL